MRRMIKGKDTQRGYCRDISVTACVQVVGTKQVIPNVKSEHLVPLEVCYMISFCIDVIVNQYLFCAKLNCSYVAGIR